MGETLITELLRYCKSTYGNDLSRSSARDLLAAEICRSPWWPSMQRWCTQLGDGYVGSRATHNDVRYRFVGYRQKTLMGCLG